MSNQCMVQVLSTKMVPGVCRSIAAGHSKARLLPDAKNKIEEKTATLRTKLILHGNRDQAR